MTKPEGFKLIAIFVLTFILGMIVAQVLISLSEVRSPEISNEKYDYVYEIMYAYPELQPLLDEAAEDHRIDEQEYTKICKTYQALRLANSTTIKE